MEEVLNLGKFENSTLFAAYGETLLPTMNSCVHWHPTIVYTGFSKS